MNEKEDPLVAQARAVRAELAARFGDDIDALCDFLVEREKDHKDQLINYSPRPPHENERRPIGIAEGEFIVPDDFDDPLPDDLLDAFGK